MQVENQIQQSAQKSGGELTGNEADEEGQRFSVASQTGVSQDEHLREPVDAYWQPETKQAETACDEVTGRVERPPDEARDWELLQVDDQLAETKIFKLSILS